MPAKNRGPTVDPTGPRVDLRPSDIDTATLRPGVQGLQCDMQLGEQEVLDWHSLHNEHDVVADKLLGLKGIHGLVVDNSIRRRGCDFVTL
jgi:hypothetical protein